MKELVKEAYKQKQEAIQARLNAFKELAEEEYLKEFIFCLLTPQSNAKSCWKAVEELFKLNLNELTSEQIAGILKGKTRFHNNKAGYVKKAVGEWDELKNKLDEQEIKELRNFLAENVKGYGLKEASHFLRNIGKSNNRVAILDRHILRNMLKLGVIDKDNVKNKQEYFEKEKKFIELAEELEIEPDALDLVFWSQQTGEIFK